MKVVEWTQPALADMAGLDRSVAIRIKNAIERFAGTGAGNVRALTGIDPLEFRLRVGDWRVRFHQSGQAIYILRVHNRREVYR